MKENKLFLLDFISIFTFFTIIILVLCINSLIDIQYNMISSNKDKLLAWIRVISSFMLCFVTVNKLLKKRKGS
jgi:hypothetical protein